MRQTLILAERGNLRLLEACDSICLSMARPTPAGQSGSIFQWGQV